MPDMLTDHEGGNDRDATNHNYRHHLGIDFTTFTRVHARDTQAFTKHPRVDDETCSFPFTKAATIIADDRATTNSRPNEFDLHFSERYPEARRMAVASNDYVADSR